MVLADAISGFLQEIARESASLQTQRAYRADLEQLLAYLTPEGCPCPDAGEIDLLMLREWLADLYHRGLKSVTLRRKIAAVRTFWKYMVREGMAGSDVARLLVIPKAPKTVPRVPSAEQTNRLLDDVEAGAVVRPSPERDLAMLEVLYGCGLRVSELVGLNLEDVDFRERVLRARGKGRKERMVPFTKRVQQVLAAWLPKRQAQPGEMAVFVADSGKRMSDRAVRRVVKIYALALTGDPTIHPHTFRHAYATHMLREGANLREIQELLGHAQLSTTQKYTQVTLTDLMAIYDKAHPRA